MVHERLLVRTGVGVGGVTVIVCGCEYVLAVGVLDGGENVRLPDLGVKVFLALTVPVLVPVRVSVEQV